MRADTFARLLILETLVDAEIGYLLEHRPAAPERFREGMIARVSDLVDEIDTLDAVAAARVYDALVDFLTELPDDDDGVVEATLRFKRAVDRTVRRASGGREPGDPAVWAVVLDELLTVLAAEYEAAFGPEGVRPREYLRARALLDRARVASERMTSAESDDSRVELRTEMDRLAFAVHYRRAAPDTVEPLIRVPQRMARRRRPTSLARIGAFVVGQLLRKR
ncbi:MAG TPA: hypothetical protein VE913_14295 [Longimicrobium sp.]|nr:hypothetical protein [Longimicrobium sp.]